MLGFDLGISSTQSNLPALTPRARSTALTPLARPSVNQWSCWPGWDTTSSCSPGGAPGTQDSRTVSGSDPEGLGSRCGAVAVLLSVGARGLARRDHLALGPALGLGHGYGPGM